MHPSMDSTRVPPPVLLWEGVFSFISPYLCKHLALTLQVVYPGSTSRCRINAKRKFFGICVGIFPSLEQLLEWISHSQAVCGYFLNLDSIYPREPFACLFYFFSLVFLPNCLWELFILTLFFVCFLFLFFRAEIGGQVYLFVCFLFRPAAFPDPFSC